MLQRWNGSQIPGRNIFGIDILDAPNNERAVGEFSDRSLLTEVDEVTQKTVETCCKHEAAYYPSNDHEGLR